MGRFRRRIVGGILATLGALTCGSCLAVTDPGSLDEGCPEGQKECDQVCVSEADPDVGCAQSGCSPCGLPHAVSGCRSSGACAVSACIGTWEDCDADPTNGCEVHLDTDAENCGSCGTSCEDPAHASAACGGSRCYVRSCDAGFGDCDQVFGNGCEADLMTDAANCGECGLACAGDCVDGSCPGGPTSDE